MADTTSPRRRTHTQNFTKPDGVELKEYLETLIAGQHDYFMARLQASEKATSIASDNLSERLAGMNEFRQAMGDLSARMITREEVALMMEKLNADIADLKKSRDQAAGKASQSSVIVSLLFGAAGIVLGAVGLIIR